MTKQNLILKYVKTFGRGYGHKQLEMLLKGASPEIANKILEIAEIASMNGYDFDTFKKLLESEGIILLDINNVKELYSAIRFYIMKEDGRET